MLSRKFPISTKRGCWRAIKLSALCLQQLINACSMCHLVRETSCCSSVLVWVLEPDERVFLFLQFSDMARRDERDEMACSEYLCEKWSLEMICDSDYLRHKRRWKLLFNLDFSRYLRVICRITWSSVIGFWQDLFLHEVWVKVAMATVHQNCSWQWLMTRCSLTLIKYFY